MFGIVQRLLTVRPKVRRYEDRLVVEPNGFVTFLTLGMSFRRVLVDLVARDIVFLSRTAYLFRSMDILPFSEASHMDYSYSSFGTSWGWTATGFDRHDEVDVFSLSIVSREGSVYPVCSFWGEGSAGGDWVAILAGDDDWIDLHGSQESESRSFARLLASLIGIPTSKPLEEVGELPTCPSCHREVSALRPTCLYCGAAVPEPE